MEEFLLTGLLGIFLITICCLNVYELMRQIWKIIPSLTLQPHMRVLLIVASTFFIHIINIWCFGITYYILVSLHLGSLSSAVLEHTKYTFDIFGYLYYSAVIYSTLGLGDISPNGSLRMITGVEALTGFILIGWTVSFTFLAMQKFWELPHSRK